ncbi:phosphoribosylformylglycinamidine synthase subunit PurL [Patescibacteria group bacterium]|nr:phosphoribosylformylglycinamidine synthase subunit PurL [Patescibacteria group bacterium]
MEIRNKRGVFDPLANGVKKDIKDLGIDGVKKVCQSRVFIISGDICDRDAHKIAKKLLVDPITQEYSMGEGRGARGEAPNHSLRSGTGHGVKVVEIAYNPGVMDPVEESAKKAIRDLGIVGVRSIKTERKYFIEGHITEVEFKAICEKLLYNKIIQHVVSAQVHKCTSAQAGDYKFRLVTVDILKASDKKLVRISKDGQLFLNLKEMKEIQKYFRKLRRNPTDCELETIAQTWSEHCAHKTFRGVVDYREVHSSPRTKTSLVRGRQLTVYKRLGNRKINNLLKNTIMKVTKDLDKTWCVSVFKDNAGIIKFDGKDNVCFKVETHNHPSALEPYGGAGTGIGGVIRDILGVGLGAKPIMNTDIFCFGLPDTPQNKVPKGMLHPKRVMKGVVSGVRDYGNRMGIPTVNGAVLFDERYTGNPLVYCGTVGIMPRNKSFKKPQSGDYIVTVGGRTGRDGIHGATFSSGELTHESEEISGGAVQIGNPITEKKVTDILLKARDTDLYDAITDCGAGGFSSAVGEMGQDLGAEVYLEKAPLKYQGLTYTEIWISEAQERMILSVPGEKLNELLNVFKQEDVEAVVIGRFTSDKRLKLRYKDSLVCDLDMKFLHDGIPRFERKAVWGMPLYKESNTSCPKDLTQSLLKILSSWNVSSKEWVIRQYDHEVQAQSVLKPLVGVKNDGPGDASIIRPKFDSKKGIIVSNGINPRYSLIDPYWMAASSIDEALRQVIAVGGRLNKTALLDNFCWGNTDKPDRLGDLVRASFACLDVAKGYGVPFISGKDSLNNEYAVHGESVPIMPTLLISAISIMDDATRAVSMDLKEKDNLIYVIGMTYDEMGGSHYNMINGFIGNNVPRVDTIHGTKVFNKLSKAIESGIIRSCHDCSEGGIGVALAEMAFAGGLGIEAFLREVPYVAQGSRLKAQGSERNDVVLFSESNTRFIAEVRKKDKDRFEKAMKGVPIGLLGRVTAGKDFKIYGLEGRKIVDVSIDKLKEAWQRPLRW